MMHDSLPEGLVPAGASRTFDETTVPEALQQEHALAPGRWGRLEVIGGQVTYIDLTDDVEHVISAPDEVVIAPAAPHRLRLLGPLRCRIDFFREEQSA